MSESTGAKSARAAADEVFQQVTDRIVAALKEERVPWHRPWRAARPPLRYLGLPFTGANSLVLSLAADEGNYDSPYWLTAAQGRQCRGTVKDGEEGTRVLRPVVFSTPVNPKTGGAHVDFPLMESYEVFNAQQFDKLPPRFQHKLRNPPDAGDKDERILAAKGFFAAIKANIKHGGDKAFYSSTTDSIQMPPSGRFDDSPSYYGTLAHEAIHWTGHKDRMRRRFGRRFGDKEYAAEELVAELGAAFVMTRLALPYAPKQAASYIGGWAEKLGGWIDVLTGDKRAFYNIAGHAQRAADFLAIAAESDRVHELARRSLDDGQWTVVYLDTVEIGSHPLVVAVGVTPRGDRHVLGMDLIGTDTGEQEKAVNKLLRDLEQRGVGCDQRRLFVTDGSALLRKPVKDIFGSKAVVQACRTHRRREVLEHLPTGAVRDCVKNSFRQAWELGAAGGPLLAQMADDIERDGHPEAAECLREDLDDLFVVDRYGLHPSLIRSLTTTSQIDRARSGLRRQVCGVARWPHARVALWWAAASFLATEQGWLKIGGHRYLRDLLEPMSADSAVRAPPAQDATLADRTIP